MRNQTAAAQIEAKYRLLFPVIDERMRRQWASAESRAYGWGGVQAISGVIRMSPNTIRKGLAELAARERNPHAVIDPRLRREGGGRKRRSESDPELLETLEWLVEPLTWGDPCSPLRWTCKSTSNLDEELSRMGHPVTPRTVGWLLNADGYSLQSNRKTKEGESHPDRNAQIEFISATVNGFKSGVNLSFRWTGRRRNWWARSRTAGVSGSPRVSRSRSKSMTFWIRIWAKPSHTGCSTSVKTKVG